MRGTSRSCETLGEIANNFSIRCWYINRDLVLLKGDYNMSSGSWENIYSEQGRVQMDILDSVVKAADLFQRKEFKKILDLGCGTGRNTLYLAKKGFEVHACDISETGISLTRELVQKEKINNVEFSIQNMYSLKYDNNIFDGVLCIWVQSHGMKREVQKGINEIRRVLKEGGVVVTDFPSVEDSSYGVGEKIEKNTFVGGRAGEEDIPHHYTNREELSEMFSEFKKVKINEKDYTYTAENGKKKIIKAFLVIAEK